GTLYNGVTTSELQISNVSAAMDGYRYRVVLNRSANICGKISEAAVLSVNPLPTTINTTLVQCDLGITPDGITLFNLNEIVGSFTGNNADLQVAFYLTQADAEAAVNELPSVYTNISNPQLIFVRTDNTSTGCFSISTLNLQVNLLPTAVINLPAQCDTDGNEDGLYVFDLTASGLPGTV